MKREHDFSANTKRLLAARAGYVCSCPDCLAPTSGPAVDGTYAVNLGEAAHITAAQPKGPRFDSNLTSDQRRDAANGIWLCAIHAALVDRDEGRFSVELLQTWKSNAEDRAIKMLGRSAVCATGNIMIASPAVRLGAETSVIVGDRLIAHSSFFDANDPNESLTWFVQAFVIQFSLLKRQEKSNAMMEHIVATVHESREIPQYRLNYLAFPATTNLYYIEVDKNSGTIAREFRPLCFYVHSPNGNSKQSFPEPLIFNDNLPAQIAVRLNSKTPGMYLISIDATVSSGSERETLAVMPPQWIIFDNLEGGQ